MTDGRTVHTSLPFLPFPPSVLISSKQPSNRALSYRIPQHDFSAAALLHKRRSPPPLLDFYLTSSFDNNKKKKEKKKRYKSPLLVPAHIFVLKYYHHFYSGMTSLSAEYLNLEES